MGYNPKHPKTSRIRKQAWRNKWRIVDIRDDSYYRPNKKKIRGWKRKSMALRQWGRNMQYPYMRYWDKGSHYMYDSYKVSPWYGFYGNRRPPHWFFKILIEQFVNAYDNWNAELHKRNSPYDLFIELHDPNYILSAIECKRTEAFGVDIYYRPLSKEQKPFPYEKYSMKGYDLTQYQWKLCDEENIYFVDEVYWRNTTVERLLSRGYTIAETDKGELYYRKKVGDVWIGRKKDASSGIKSVAKRLYPTPAP